MSKTLSSDVSPVLAIQGHSALVRKAIAYAPIQLLIKQTASEIKIQQYTTAGFPAINECAYKLPMEPGPLLISLAVWTCDWQERIEQNMFTGRLCTKSRWIQASDINDKFLSHSASSPEEELIEAHAESLDKKWKARQIWSVDDAGRFIRRVKVTKGKEEACVVLVYEKKGHSSISSSPSLPSSHSSPTVHRKDSFADSETDDGNLTDGSLIDL
jgi:hypothetical protein